MNKHVSELAYQGNWTELLPLLRARPDLVNHASESKGYTPLHQAAWHSASLAVVGELLALGADTGLRTRDKSQTAIEIANEKHADRLDLEYVLAPRRRSLSQLIRKVVSDNPALFGPYDGNQVVCDRLIECFSSVLREGTEEELETRLDVAFRVVTGVPLSSSRPIKFEPAESFGFGADPNFWRDQFLPLLRANIFRAHVIPIEKEWAAVSDLFDPAPTQWGLRGDLFLWMEMRQVLCHAEIPKQPEELAQTISSVFTALTGTLLERTVDVRVKRLARGGLSSGEVCGDFWAAKFIPLIQTRSLWLQETWRR